MAEAFLPSPVIHNHASFLQWLPDGSLACAWFAGTLEGRPDIFIRMSTLAPGAAQWSAADQVSDDETRSEQNPVIFTDPQSGSVGLFHTAQPGGRQEECVVRFRPIERTAAGVRSGPPRTLDLPKGSFVRGSVVVRDDGAWMLPLFLCKVLPGARWTGSHDTAAVAVSQDRGESWSLMEVPNSVGLRAHDHRAARRRRHGGVLPAAAGGLRLPDGEHRRRTQLGQRPSRRTSRTTTPRSSPSGSPMAASRCCATQFPRRIRPPGANPFMTSSARRMTGARTRWRGCSHLGRAARSAHPLRVDRRRQDLPATADRRGWAGNVPFEQPARWPEPGAVVSRDGAGAGRCAASRIHLPSTRHQICPAGAGLGRSALISRKRTMAHSS